MVICPWCSGHRSPEARDAVGVESLVHGNEPQTFNQGRSGDQAVEGVLVVQGQRGQRLDVLWFKR